MVLTFFILKVIILLIIINNNYFFILYTRMVRALVESIIFLFSDWIDKYIFIDIMRICNGFSKTVDWKKQKNCAVYF